MAWKYFAGLTIANFIRTSQATGIVLLLFLGIPIVSHAQNIRAALDAYSKGDYAAAISQARPLAEQGHAVAEGLLGVMYEYGQGVSSDFREALSWYRKAAEQGMAPAQFSVGAAYATGREVPKDDREAVKWYVRSAEQNYAPAQLRLGVAYALGAGVARDPVRAHMWISLAIEKKSQEQEIATEARAKLESELTARQIAEARRLAAEWKAKKRLSR
jgi:TPR repeat protein